MYNRLVNRGAARSLSPNQYQHFWGTPLLPRHSVFATPCLQHQRVKTTSSIGYYRNLLHTKQLGCITCYLNARVVSCCAMYLVKIHREASQTWVATWEAMWRSINWHKSFKQFMLVLKLLCVWNKWPWKTTCWFVIVVFQCVACCLLHMYLRGAMRPGCSNVQ